MGRVASGSGAARDRPGSCWQSSRWEGRLARDSDGGRPGGPLGCPAAAPGTATGGRCVRGFLKRPERRGSASGGDPERAGPERRGDTGGSRCSESRGGRENWEWPLSERGGRWGDPGLPGSGMTGSGGKAPRTGRAPPEKGRCRLGRVCGVETLNELPRGGTAAPCPPQRSGTGVRTEDPRRKGFEPSRRSWDLSRVRVQRESGSSLKQNGMEVRGEE